MNRRAGMTLIEVLLAIAILITGLVAVFAMLLTSADAQRRAKIEVEAAAVASSVLADLRGEFFNGHEVRSDPADTYLDSPDMPGYQYNRLIVPMDPPRRNAPAGAANREYSVRLKVRWMQQGENKFLAVETIMFRNLDR